MSTDELKEIDDCIAHPQGDGFVDHHHGDLTSMIYFLRGELTKAHADFEASAIERLDKAASRYIDGLKDEITELQEKVANREHYAELGDEAIDRLRGELERARARYTTDMKSVTKEAMDAEVQRDKARAKSNEWCNAAGIVSMHRDSLAAALRKFGRHDEDCPAIWGDPEPCDCGLDAALAEGSDDTA